MLKPILATVGWYGWCQPPLGGCVLKLNLKWEQIDLMRQPPLGGCVLKLHSLIYLPPELCQPPLGGCVLKP